MKLHKYMVTVLLLASTLTFAGCGSNAEYDSYHKEVNALYEKIITADAKINNIDVNSEASAEELFSTLDSLKTSFNDFSLATPPEEFKDCQYLSENAVKYIEISEEKFHEALDGEYNENSFNEGITYYNEVIKCVNYMGDVLQNNQQ